MSLAGGPRPHRLRMQVPEEQHEGPKEAPEVVVPVDVTLLIQFYVPKHLGEKSNRKQRASRSCGTCPAPGHQASLWGGRERVGLADARTGPLLVARADHANPERPVGPMLLYVAPPTPKLVILFPWHSSNLSETSPHKGVREAAPPSPCLRR